MQIILDILNTKIEMITTGTKAFICGYATHDQIINADKKDFGSKLSDKGNYNCYYLPVSKLSPVEELKLNITW